MGKTNLVVILFLILSSCMSQNVKESNSDYNSIIIEKSKLALQKNNTQYADTIALDKLIQIFKNKDGSFKAISMPSRDSLKMLLVLGSSFKIVNVIAYNEREKELSSIFGSYIDSSDKICVLNNGSVDGYFVFSPGGGDYFLKACYLPGGLFLSF